MEGTKNRYFLREFELDVDDGTKTMTLFQKEVGDVSCVVWDAALVLAKYLEMRSASDADWMRGKRVIELGAGVGCVGLTAACLGGNVIMTDLPEVLELLEKNIKCNSHLLEGRDGKAAAQALKWGRDTRGWERPQLLLLADCVYYQESVEPLIATMRDLADTDTEVLLCQERRPTERQVHVWQEFMSLLSQHFHVSYVPEEEQHATFCSPDIALMRLRRRAC